MHYIIWMISVHTHCTPALSTPFIIRLAIHLSQNMRRWAQNAKNEECIAGYFTSLFLLFVPHFSLFAFCSISRQGRHSRGKSKDLVIYFFAALIKYDIRMKYEKCIASVKYFVACFAKTLAKCEVRKMYSQPNTRTLCLWFQLIRVLQLHHPCRSSSRMHAVPQLCPNFTHTCIY